MLRAICEVAIAPEHEDGLMGDALNMLLTVTNTINSVTDSYGDAQEYVDAQKTGLVSICSNLFS